MDVRRAEPNHTRVFDDEEWANGYYKRHKKWAIRTAKGVIARLKELGFTGGRILDAGCGFGLTALEVAKAFPKAKVMGIDLSEPLLRIARDLTKEAGLTDRATFEKRDVTKTDLEDGSFDFIISFYVLHLVEDPKAMVDEMERLLTPKGIMLIKDLKRSWLGHFDNAIATSFTKNEAEEILGRSQLRSWSLKSSIMHLEIEAPS
jgi:ubiquinone/menaquinone biosynthesis C-methylase UbiE